MNYAEAFLRDQMPNAQRALIKPTLQAAYQAAAEHIKETPLLNIPSAQDNWGRIIQWAVDFGFLGLLKSNQWQFDWRWAYFEKPTGRYLEIRPSHSILTISQVADPKKQPRDVVFRANMRLNGQAWLAGMQPEDLRSAGVPHILLVHGHQSLNFAHLGVPKDAHHRGYHYRTANLMLAPSVVATAEPPPEDTDMEAVMTLKSEIDKWRKDNGIE